MKKLLFVLCLLLSATISFAHVQQLCSIIDLEVRKYDPTGALEQPEPGTTAMMSTIYITSNTTYNTNMTIGSDIVVTNGATLTITSVVTLSGGASISAYSGASIIIDGGTVQNAVIHLNSGSSFSITNGGTISLLTGETFEVPAGAVLEFDNGIIN